MSGPLGDKVPAKPQQPKRPALAGAAPARKDVVVGPDGRWQTQNYVPVPVFTKKEPKP